MAVGAVTGGIGMAANAVTKVAVTAAKTVVQQVLVKLSTQVVAGIFSGCASYLITAKINGEDISFNSCLNSMLVGGLTGAFTCLTSVALENVTTKVSGLMAALQVLSGGYSGAASYLLSIALTGKV